MRLEVTHDSNQHHLALEFFVHGIRYFIGCVLDRLFCITGELFCLALRLLSEALGLQLFRARNFTGGFLDFSRGLIGYARNLVLPIIHLLVWVYVTLTIPERKPANKVPMSDCDCTQTCSHPRQTTIVDNCNA